MVGEIKKYENDYYLESCPDEDTFLYQEKTAIGESESLGQLCRQSAITKLWFKGISWEYEKDKRVILAKVIGTDKYSSKPNI